MKVIFYGGCHAAALRRIFEKFAVGVSSVAHLTSYSLIRAGKPVPYDEFLNFDAVVFSPIRNKQGYNTHQLEEHLDKAGRLRVKFPWLQWEGYHPGYQSSGRHDWYSGWWPSSLEIAAREHQTFEDFVQSIYEGDLLADISLENVEKATLRFRDREFDCDVKVAQYVHENYRKSRLFLTPDHAATVLYKPIATQVANLLGVKLDPAFYEMSDEIQHGIRMPILSSVRRALELEFHGGEFENKLIF